MKTVAAILSISCILLAGAANGVMDTLQFHYSASVFSRMENQQYWNPKISWENKYAKDGEGALVRPLRPAYLGSTTVLSWATDGWHMAKAIFLASFRTAIVLLASMAWRISRRRWLSRLAWAAIWAGLAGLQGAGFHLMYSYFLKT